MDTDDKMKGRAVLFFTVFPISTVLIYSFFVSFVPTSNAINITASIDSTQLAKSIYAVISGGIGFLLGIVSTLIIK